MTIGEKIYILRTKARLSQESLAAKLDVTRQSISKWELNEATPGLSKIPLLSEIFDIDIKLLISEDYELEAPADAINDSVEYNNKYFGTDGYRGEANVQLTSLNAYKVGRFLGWFYSKNLPDNRRAKIVIGKDTRLSSYMLEYSLIAGIVASGTDVYMLHVTTTPSVSYVTRMDGFDAGVMITASHNPYYDNGIKVINRYGEKLDDKTASLIESYIDGDIERLIAGATDLPYAVKDKIGKIVDYSQGRNRYIGYLISIATHSFKNLKIGIDTANGASFSIAKSVFEALGAQVYVTGCEPNGTNINLGVGSTHIENLSEFVKENHLDLGFAFDGDADRCLAVDERGNVVDGDKIMYILAMRLKEMDNLDHNTVVATIMSNSGLIKAFKKQGIECVQTQVGDRFVYEKMQECDYKLGGEQSGHIILKKYATTGDGILTAIMLAEQVCDKKTNISTLCRDVVLFPQITKNVRVFSKEEVMQDKDILNRVEDITARIGDNGRILLRKSGTEPVIRIMAECETVDICNGYINELYKLIESKGYINGEY